MKSQIAFLVFVGLFLQGCSTVVRLPTSTRQTPLTAGKSWGGHFGFDFASSAPVTIINDVRTTPPTRNSIEVGTDSNISSVLFPGLNMLTSSNFDIAAGIIPNLELYYTNNLGVKWQFMGPNRVHQKSAEPVPEGESKKGLGWVGAVFIGPFSEGTSLEESGHRSDIAKSGIEAGVSIGNRWDVSQLVYFTFATRGGKAGITVTQSSGTKYTYNDEYDQLIATIGITAGERFYFKGELTGVYINWKGHSDNLNRDISGAGTYGGLTAGFGYNF